MLSKEEKFVCEIIWGGVPVDVIWVKQSKLFIEALENFKKGELSNELFINELKKRKR